MASLLRREPARAPARSFFLPHGHRPNYSKEARMKTIASLVALTIGLFGTSVVLAADSSAATPAPAGSTGLCRDGTYTTNAIKKGACTGHKGVKTWTGGDTAAAAASATPAATPATKPVKAAAATATTTAASASPAPGGGPGMVWVNSSSKVYHCPGTKRSEERRVGTE